MKTYYGVEERYYDDGTSRKRMITTSAESIPKNEEEVFDNEGLPGGYDYYLDWFETEEEAIKQLREK